MVLGYKQPASMVPTITPWWQRKQQAQQPKFAGTGTPGASSSGSQWWSAPAGAQGQMESLQQGEARLGTGQGYGTTPVLGSFLSAQPETTAPPLDPNVDPRPNTAGLNNNTAQSVQNGLAAIYGQTAANRGGQQTAEGFRVNVPSGYGKPNAYYYNGHAVQGDKGQWITLPVAYSEAADTRRWEYNGTNQESTMRRAIRYAFDDVRNGATDFNAALIARLKQFYAEAGGQGVGYTINAASPTGGATMPGTGTATPATDPATDPAAASAAQAAAAAAAGNAGQGNTGTGQAQQGTGRYGTLAIQQAAENQTAGFELLLDALGISDTFGNGPFSDFFERSMGPILTSILNAQAAGDATIPTNIDQTVANLKTMLAGGTVGGQDLYQNLQGLGKQAMQRSLGSNNATTIDMASSAFSPLRTYGMNAMGRQGYYTLQDQALRAMRNRGLTSPTLGNEYNDWDTFYQQSPFYERYYR